MLDTIGDLGSLIGGVAAAVGLVYTGLQLRFSVGQQYFQMLNQFADSLEALETSKERNTDHTIFATRYLNNLDRIAFLALKRHIDKRIVKDFEHNFKAALGLLEMKEYREYRKYPTNLIKWCEKEKLQPDPPPLPYQDISIISKFTHTNDNSKFTPRKYEPSVGCFVTWINQDTEPHTVTSGNGEQDPNKGAEFDSGDNGILALTIKGRKYSHRFDKSGTYHYFCRYHSAETGEINVMER
jgi:plastocyanin